MNILKSNINTWKEFCFKMYLKNMIIVIQHNILKIFIKQFSKINQTYFIIVLLMNEREIYIKILGNTMLFHDYIFKINSKKKILSV